MKEPKENKYLNNAQVNKMTKLIKITKTIEDLRIEFNKEFETWRKTQVEMMTEL